MELRPYQSDAVQALRFALAGGAQRIMLNSPTGSGKTEMGMEIIRGAARKQRRVVFLANRIHLVAQTSRRFAQAGIAHGVIQGENTWAPHSPVIVASIQTLARRQVPPCDLIVIDEAHGVAGSKAYRELIFRHSALPIIGLSATPWSRGLGRVYPELGGALFERMVTAATIPELIEQGYLVDCDVYAPSEPDMTGAATALDPESGERDWTPKAAAERANTAALVGDIVAHWLRLARGTPTVCFAADIAHSKHICAQFQAVGVRAEHLDCYTPEEDRVAILARMERGETQVLCNVGILAEGWDFPACRTLILARPTKSRIRFIQMAGRVLRPFLGKDRALILDHSGTVLRLGFPTDPYEADLDDGKPKAAGGDTAKKEPPLPSKCPVCAALKPAKVHACPKCGFAPQKQSTIEAAEGDLVQVKRGAKPTVRETLQSQGKQAIFSQALGLAQQRNKPKPDNWAKWLYREVFGVWPRGVAAVPTAPGLALSQYATHAAIRAAKSNGGQRRAA